MAEIRLQKVIADAGVCSRRAAEELIAAGRVTVNGERAQVGSRADPGRDRIEIDERPLPLPVHFVYLAMWKPAGVTSTVADRHAARTVLDLVPASVLREAGRLYPVGRLDRESEGLLLLANDGEWAERVLHPSHGVEREYAVGIGAALSSEQERALRHGIALDEGTAMLIGLRMATPTETRRFLAAAEPGLDPGVWYRVTLGHGWKRQVRRMFAAVGAPVERLARVRIGTLGLRGLRAGEIRRLAPGEVSRIGRLPPPADTPARPRSGGTRFG
jgi:23S rRNA pseudouridine2605 synthase